MIPLPTEVLRVPAWLAAAVPVIALALVACEGCRSTKTTGPTPTLSPTDSPALPDPGPPTARLYIVSDMAGALEPCGCTKDQLGGLDHFAAWMETEKTRAPASAVVAAGPLFFLDPELRPDHVDQDIEKAETLARAWKRLGLVAFTPAENDWAAGKERTAKLATASGASMLLGNLTPEAPAPEWARSVVRDIGGLKIGFIGVGAPPPAAQGNVKVAKSEDVVRDLLPALKKEGATVFIVLTSLGRGEAKRIAEANKELAAVVVGERKMGGEGNTTSPPAERVDNVLIAETANHLQSVAVLDLFVRDGSYTFADATGIDQAQKREELTKRIDDLRVKISNWERDGKIAKADIAARRADMQRLEKERAALDVRPPPASGSFFRYTVKEIRESLGRDASLIAEMSAYYKKVNDHNKELFKDRLPKSHTGEQASYIGVNACTACHEKARKFWDTTPHAHAYATLSKQFKEFNLDCVSCHVTGYDQPGGTTVTHVERLTDVQCEVCHGPGSKHPVDPKNRALIVTTPKPDTCLACHHPPHVEQFDARAKMSEILGPGHGRR